MKTVAIIAEYNPFHNGHQYQIEEARRITKADYVIVIMSGYFVQRGAPAIMDKHTRTQMALDGGADVILELPVIYATASAEIFAFGAVSILNELTCIDYLCFGSECGEVSILKEAAAVLLEEPENYREFLKIELKKGNSYPAARQTALLRYFSSMQMDMKRLNEIKEVLEKPNNILGIEYIKAILRLGSTIEPITILRKGYGYHDLVLSENTEEYSSASAIREFIEARYDKTKVFIPFDKLYSVMPESSAKLIESEFGKSLPITIEDISPLIHYLILINQKAELTDIADITEELANRMKSVKTYPFHLHSYAMELKTKQYTLTRIRRSFLHLLLQISARNLMEAIDNSRNAYARVLGFKKSASLFLRYAQDNSRVPIITKLADGEKTLKPFAFSLLQKDILAAELYGQLIGHKFHIKQKNEFKEIRIV